MTVLSLPKRDHSAPLTELVAEEIRVLAARHKSEGVNQTVLASVIGVSQSQMSKRLLGSWLRPDLAERLRAWWGGARVRIIAIEGGTS
jgi:hypothetical protein